jgi:hypothetical protein
VPYSPRIDSDPAPNTFHVSQVFLSKNFLEKHLFIPDELPVDDHPLVAIV